MKKSFGKIISIIMALTLVVSCFSAFAVNAGAAKSTGNFSVKSESYGAFSASHTLLQFVNASSTEGNSATYIVDRFYNDNLSQLGQLYFVGYEVNACAYEGKMQSSNPAYGFSSGAYVTEALSSKKQVHTTKAATGNVIGDVPEAGKSVSFTVTQSLVSGFYYNSSVVTDNCSSVIDLTFIGVDTTALRSLVSQCCVLSEDCWTNATWSVFNNALNNAKAVIDSTTALQNDIDTAYDKLSDAKANLIHNGDKSKCDYCLTHGETPYETVLFTDILYGSDPFFQSLNLALPINKTGEVPLILHIHGGSWTGGQKEDYGDYPVNDCRSFGVASASVSYRYIAEGSVNAFDIMDDITASLYKIKDFAAKKGIIINKMMIDGYSAGAHLSLLYGYSRADKSPIEPVCIFARSAPTNMCNDAYLSSTVASPSGVCSLFSALCGKSFNLLTRSSAMDALYRVSPVAYVNSNSLPTAVIHGNTDDKVDISEAKTLIGLLSSYGVPHDVIIYPNSGHNLDNPLDTPCLELTNELYAQYINAYLLDTSSAMIDSNPNTNTVIDRDKHFIYGLEEGITSLDGFVNCKNCTLDYHPTSNGFGTGTKADIVSSGKVVETYSLAVIGDVTGDGYIDSFDVSVISAISNFENEFESGSVYEFAGDIERDGFIDAIDLAKIIAAANYESTVPQVVK